jgi:eukaryotic-like serine/threonine-protein kinase
MPDDPSPDSLPAAPPDSLDAELSEGLRSLLTALAAAPAGASPPSSLQIRPGDTFGRYRLERELGRGGFGLVFAAHDVELDRRVAVKVTRFSGGDLEQFRREARLAARLNHPRIVTLYDSGSVAGLPYLVMELLDGETLQARLDRQPPDADEALAMAIELAAALAHAHAAGVLHLDLKPSNVFVARDGGLKVLDFGLAQMIGAAQGPRGGTPSYMAPEQRRGEPVDERTDVFALGIMLRRLFARDPPAPLPSIVSRALAEDPAARFPSSDALLQALVAVRLSRQRRGQRRWLMLGAATLATVLVAAIALQVIARRRAVDDARLAQAIGQEAQAIEAAMREARLRPLHDLRPDLADGERRARAMEARLSRAGDAGAGAGELALGRVWLALDEPEIARRHLQTAERRGYHEPDLDAQLGRALGLLYARQLAEIDRLPDRDLRAHRMTLLAPLRDDALAHLRAGHSPSPLLAGRLALYEHRLDDAAALAVEAAARSPADYETARLAGDVHARRAEDALADDDAQTALAASAAAGDAYARAAEIARSDGALYVSDCRRLDTRVRALALAGSAVDDEYRRAAAACDRALTADPDDGEALVQAAELRRDRAQLALDRGQNIEALIAEGDALAARARAAHPDDPAAAAAAGRLALLAASAQLSGGGDPRATLARASDAFRRAVALRPDGDDVAGIGAAFDLQARYEVEHNLDPRASFDRVFAALDRLPSSRALLTVARAAVRRGEWERTRGGDARGWLDRAVGYLQRAEALTPKDAELVQEEGRAHMTKALYQRFHGIDPLPELATATLCLQRAVTLEPQRSAAWKDAGLAFLYTAQEERRRLLSTDASLPESIRMMSRALALNPRNPDYWGDMGIVHALAAEVAFDADRDPRAAVAHARDAIARSTAIRPDEAFTSPPLCDAELVEARWLAIHHLAAAAAFARVYDVCRRASILEPDNASVGFHRLVSLRIIAGWKIDSRLPARREVDEGLQLADKLARLDPTLRGLPANRAQLLWDKAQQAPPSSRQADARVALAALEAAARDDAGFIRDMQPSLAAARRLVAGP